MKSDALAYHGLLIKTLFPDAMLGKESTQRYHTMLAYADYLPEEDAAPFKALTDDLRQYLVENESWLFDPMTDFTVPDTARSQFGLICEHGAPGNDDEHRKLSFYINMRGSNPQYAVWFPAFLGFVEQRTGVDVSWAQDEYTKILDIVLSARELPPFDRDLAVDGAQEGLHMLLRDLLEDNPLIAGCLLELIYGRSDIIMIKRQRDAFIWYPMFVSGTDGARLVGVRRKSNTITQAVFENGATFELNLNLKNLLRKEHTDYLSVVDPVNYARRYDWPLSRHTFR